MQPLVSVICLCHNHKAYLAEAIASVLNQTYPNIEVIVVDDASRDGSKALLREICESNALPYIDIPENIGNCAAFNQAFFLSRGKYIIDFATDDVMMPQRLERQVRLFEGLEDSVGVIFSNALLIDEKGKVTGMHYKLNPEGQPKQYIPTGFVYAEVLSRYFISPPTMMIQRKVLEDLNGYDESLAYEDFDFWVRSARKYSYVYQNECLTKVRKVRHSLSSKLYKKDDRQLISTYKVCAKAVDLNSNKKEEKALIKRLRYEARHAVLTGNHKEAKLFFDLLKEQHGMNFCAFLFKRLNGINIHLRWAREIYLKLRHGVLSG